jgi:hypothetical protein
MEYEVRVCEKKYTYITVDAPSMTAAKLAAQQKYEAGDYTPDARGSKRVAYETLYPDYDRSFGRSR